jgi:hypothetical protein
LGFGAFVAASLLSVVAHGQEPPPDAVLASVNAHAGLGTGSLGLASHAGVSGQAWLAELFAIGAQAGFIGSEAVFGDRSSVWYLGPSASIRSAGGGTYLFVTGGAGWSWRTIQEERLCILGPCSTAPPLTRSEQGPAFQLALGAAFHVGSFEFGPVVRADSVAGGQVLTANMVVGGALTRGPTSD